MTFTETLNFSQKKDNDRAIKLYSRTRDFGYYYDNLCLYCANNDINITEISDADFSSAVEIMESHGARDLSTDHYFFWID